MKFTFQRAIKFRTWGFIIALLSITYFGIFNEMIGTVILLAISFFVIRNISAHIAIKSLILEQDRMN